MTFKDVEDLDFEAATQIDLDKVDNSTLFGEPVMVVFTRFDGAKERKWIAAGEVWSLPFSEDNLGAVERHYGETDSDYGARNGSRFRSFVVLWFDVEARHWDMSA